MGKNIDKCVNELEQTYENARTLTMRTLDNTEDNLQVLTNYYKDLVNVMSYNTEEYDYEMISKSGLSFIFEMGLRTEQDNEALKAIKNLLDVSLSVDFEDAIKHLAEERFKKFKVKMQNLKIIINQIELNDAAISEYIERIRYLVVLIITSGHNPDNFNLEEMLAEFENNNDLIN